MEYENTTLEIMAGSCDGHEAEFAAWVSATYPAITVEMNSTRGGHFYNETGDFVDPYNPNALWEKFCSQ